jgi:nitrogen-specific signal transduction histidine kinase/CheY-like chemotaxis protein
MTTSLRHWYEEAKRRDDELRQAQKMEAIGRLAGGIAHDFNNLLTAISGYAEIVLRHVGPQDPMRDDVVQILTAADRAAELTKQLLTFSRRQAVTSSVLALDQVVTGTEPMLRRIIGEDIALTTSIEPGLGRVCADRGQMEQVLLNLVVNARDAMPNGGTLQIALTNAAVGAAPHDVTGAPVPDRYVCLSVADTGNGMDRDTASRVFEPFFTTKGTGQGTGLGLAIVYGIVKEAGGLLDVDTEIGRGTTINVYMPRVADGEEARPLAAAREPAPAVSARASETVLLVEDDHRLGVLIRNTLSGSGYNVLQAFSADEALEIARTHSAPIHILVTDVVMPGMNGRMLADRVKRLRLETRVLFMSGHSDDAISRAGVQTAGADFVRKPFSMEALAKKIHETLTTSAGGLQP